jgi:hypothetical protein
MDVIARRAFERPNVEANRAGGNPRQLGTRLAHGAEWSQDGHDAIASGSGGSVTELSVTGRYRGADDGATVEPIAIPALVNFAHFRKVNVLVEAKSNLATMGQIRPAQPLRCYPGRTPVVTDWDTDNFW